MHLTHRRYVTAHRLLPNDERRGEIDTLHHVLVPVNWNVAVDQAHTILQEMGSRIRMKLLRGGNTQFTENQKLFQQLDMLFVY